MKKIINIITLIVMISVNLIDPFTYAFYTGDDFELIQDFIETIEDDKYSDDIEDSDSEEIIEEDNANSEDKEENIENSEIKNYEEGNNISDNTNEIKTEENDDEEIIADLNIEQKNNDIEISSINATITGNDISDTIQITYDLNGGYRVEDSSTLEKTITYTKNESGNYIASDYYKTPSKETGCGENEDKKCMFVGWYDESLTTRWIGNVTENIEVFAKWQEFENLDVYIINSETSGHYTMMDRNMGATERFNQLYDQSNQASHGYHYQWGNNYGFESCYTKDCTNFPGGENISGRVLDNSLRENVMNSKFYQGVYNSGSNRGPGVDVTNLWGGKTDSFEARQGPCPQGYHIPTNEEWQIIMNNSRSVGVKYRDFSIALLLSQPGYRDAEGKLYNVPHNFWSSDSYINKDKINVSYLKFDSGNLSFETTTSFNNARSIRCFKNENSDSFSFDISHIILDGGSRVEISITSGKIVYINNPKKTGYIFKGWYKDSQFEGQKVEVGDTILPSDYLFAKWENCPDGYVADDESLNCLSESIASVDNQKNSQIVEDLDIFMIDGDNQTYHYTLMDRNMGAKERFNGEINNQNENTYGFVYQWGNNYGFPSTGLLENYGFSIVGYSVPKFEWIKYSPSKYSRNVRTLIDKNDIPWMDEPISNGLWRGNGSEAASQGPCPDGYYIPDVQKFTSIVDNWKSANRITSSAEFCSNFLVPQVPYRNTKGILTTNSYGLWTSKPGNWNRYSERAAYFYINSLNFSELNYANGLPVRCFKKDINTGANIFDVSHIELNSGSRVVLSLLSGGEIVALTSPYRIGHNFEGRYKNPDFEGQKVEVGDILLPSDYLFAKWGDCPDGSVKNLNNDCQVVQDLDVYFVSSTGTKSHYTLMDRNIGASARYNQNKDNPNTLSFGYYYQWGNNYGFPTIGNNIPSTSTTSTLVNDVSEYGWNNTYYSTTFVFNSSDNGNSNWMKTLNTNLWGGDEDDLSRKQGPCPDGYHVPSSGERKNISDGWINAFNSTSPRDGTKRNWISYDLLMPMAGYRSRKNSNVADNKTKIRYLSSSADASDSRKRVYNFNYGTDSSDNDVLLEHGANAFSVRCKKNVENTSIIENLYLNGGTNAVISLSAGEIVSLQTPKRKNSKFVGWYTTPDFSGNKLGEGSGVELGSSLYAKFECSNNSNYKRNGSDCVPEYTITFNSNGGSTVESQKVLKNLTGTKPEDPIRDGYEFRYWHKNGSSTPFDFENTLITSSITLIAKWEIKEYSINYIGIDGATFENQNPNKYTIESSTITLNNPTKQHYNFIGWSGTNIVGTSNLVVISTNSTGDRIYEANWEAKKYTITWKDGNNDTLKEEQVNYGVVPSYSGAIPTKTPTAQTGYTFNNTWNPTPYAVNGNETYVAQFDENVNKYTIKFIDGDGHEISSKEYDYGTTKENIEIPTNVTKTFTPMTGYIFIGWDKEIGTVTTGATYTAQFDEYTRSYLITWENGNGEVIDSGEVLYGIIPSHADVESGGNAEYTYIFSGWIPKIVAVTTGATYTADYIAQKNKYLIKFVDEDGTILQSGNVEYGETPIYSGEDPKKAGTEQYTYKFTGWGEPILPVTGSKVYTAHYDEIINKYTITWIDGDGNILYSGDVSLGEMPVYLGPIPTKTSTVDYNYIFNGNWIPEIKVVTGDMQYVAQFDKEYIKRDEGGHYSGAGKRKSRDDTEQSHGSPEDQGEDSSNEGNTKIVTIKNTEITATVKNTVISNNPNYTKEFNEAYSFAKSNGITTTDSIETAKMNTSLTRIQMAKMLSNYAINILGKEPDLSKGTIKFDDVTNKLDKEYDNGVTLAYQLGIMGIDMKNNLFRPNDEVTRAEFATALSRLLYSTPEGKNKGTSKYYQPHIAKLYNEGIISNTNPILKEKRGYVMLMLMRSSK